MRQRYWGFLAIFLLAAAGLAGCLQEHSKEVPPTLPPISRPPTPSVNAPIESSTAPVAPIVESPSSPPAPVEEGETLPTEAEMAEEDRIAQLETERLNREIAAGEAEMAYAKEVAKNITHDSTQEYKDYVTALHRNAVAHYAEARQEMIHHQGRIETRLRFRAEGRRYPLSTPPAR